MRSIEKIAPHYFLDFLHDLCPLVENNIHKQLTRRSLFQEKIYSVLHEVSWTEWKNKPILFVNPLSRIINTLFYDKILLSFQQKEYHYKIDIFLEKISTLVSTYIEEGIDSEEAQTQFIRIINDFWKLSIEPEPSVPIMNKNFPFNKLIDLLFLNWECCMKSIKLIQNIKEDSKGVNQLLLPYIFEIGIPERRKQLQGQIFTPLEIVNFICKQNITDETTRVIDPACGTGIFLLGALHELVESKIIFSNRIVLIGIERDPILADIARSAIQYFLVTNSISSVDWRLINDDFFNYSKESLEFSGRDSGRTTLLMNPPYTRHELLPLEYKEFIKNKIEINLQNNIQKHEYAGNSISGRSGLYVYFLIHATNFLKEGDYLGLIVPNSWMDVDYGKTFQNFMLNNYLVHSIISSRLKKLISNVDVNTAIINLEKKGEKTFQDIFKDESLVNFISIGSKTDLEQLVKKEHFQQNRSSSEIRVVSIKQENLYSKSKWGVYFRAPKDYFDMMEKLEDKLITLKEIASVRRGFTSGANEFFYVGKPGRTNTLFISDWNPKSGQLLLYLKDEFVTREFEAQGFHISEPMFLIEKEYWMHQTDNSGKNPWQYSITNADGSLWVPNYLVKSPRDLKTYKIHEKDLNYIVILIPSYLSGNELKPGIREYIRWGEEWIPSIGGKFNQRPTCRSRKIWYSLPSNEYRSFNLLCLMTINDRFPFFYNPYDFYFDARLYGIKFLQENDMFQYYFLILNSLFATLQMELLGRSNLGEGGLDIKVYEYELLKVPCYEFLSQNQSQDINHDFLQVLEYSPYSIIQGKPQQLKQMTNDLVANLLQISHKLIDSLFNDLKKLVKMRIEKAKD
ncbi:MAG: class I SAM-dependent DNA methyltransferase [Candidatus Hodarchaeota archaeon]